MIPTQLSPTDVGITPTFMRRQAPELASDIVCQLDHSSKLAASYGLTDQQWMVLKTWPAFREMVQRANEELGGPSGSLMRARRKAQLAMAEVGVGDLATIAGDPKVPARDRTKAIEILSDIAGTSARAQQQVAAGGGAFGGPLIQIVMPNGAQISVGEVVEPAAAEPALPVIEGESRRVEGSK